MTIWTFLVCFSLINLLQAQTIVKFGAFFDVDDVDGMETFDIAVSRQNAFNTQFRLEPIKRNFSSMDSFKAERAVCELVEQGAVAIVGIKSVYTTDVVASICNDLNIPHLVSYHRTADISKNLYHKFTRNIHPDIRMLADALKEVISNYGWKRFSIIYDNDEALVRLDGILQMYTAAPKSISLYKFPGTGEVKNLLKQISKSMDNRIIIDCKLENLAEIVKQSLNDPKLKKMNEYMSLFITNPDGHMLNTPELKQIKSNITAIRLMPSEDVEANNIIEWKRKKKYFSAAQWRYADQITQPNRLKIEAALIRDLITVLSNALTEKKLYKRIREPVTRCDDVAEAGGDGLQFWDAGQELLQNIDDKIARGITGPISFKKDYKTREDFNMHIVEYKYDEKTFLKIAEWNAFEKLVVTRTSEELTKQRTEKIQNKKFRVVSRTGMPYLQVINGTDLKGNDRFEGFVKDFMDAIAKEKNFTYTLELDPDNHQGKHDPHSGKWDGMIGDIIDGKADLAVCDLTITFDRKNVIDFSAPFMTLGISILYAKPNVETPGLLNFLKPLDTKVWLYIATAFLSVSLTIFFLARITEAEWLKPHPCDDNPEELENIWTMSNCFWLAAGSIVQQGCDILPKGIPTRMTTVAWWFFVMIITNTYIANMAAFLTKEQMEESIESVEDLAKESKIKYGLMRDGSTESFFRESNHSLYQKMWATMEHHESVFVATNEDGIKRVLDGNRGYAFLMESASIEYITHKYCNKLTKVGGWLDSKAYGIGMPLNSPYRDDIDEAILKLKESRVVQELKTKWWKEKNILIGPDNKPVDCAEAKEKSDDDNPDLDLEHVLGAFLVLMAGIALAFLVGIIEFVWNARKVSIELKITPYEAIRREFKFAYSIWITRKPVLKSLDSELESLSSINSSAKK